jgi:hypothetical protein
VDIRHEAVEFLSQPRAFSRKGARRIQHIRRCGAGFRGAAIDLHDIGGSGKILVKAPNSLARRLT